MRSMDSTGWWTRSKSTASCRPSRPHDCSSRPRRSRRGLPVRSWRRSPSATAGSPVPAHPSPSPGTARTRCSKRLSSSSSTSRQRGSQPHGTRSASSEPCACEHSSRPTRSSRSSIHGSHFPSTWLASPGCVRKSCGGQPRSTASSRASSPSPATTSSWRTTPGSTSASSSSSYAVGAFRSLRSAPPRSRVACSRAGSAASAWLPSRTSSAFRPCRVTVRCRTRRRRPRCSFT